jgi:hypothetical protein
MARHFPRDHHPFDPDDVATPGVMRALLYLVALAAFIGLICGIVWTLWHLVRLYVLT